MNSQKTHQTLLVNSSQQNRLAVKSNIKKKNRLLLAEYLIDFGLWFLMCDSHTLKFFFRPADMKHNHTLVTEPYN